MDALYSKINGAHDIRINNWSAARDSGTDFNNNSRNVQCGKGFAGGDPPLNAAGNGPCPFAGASTSQSRDLRPRGVERGERGTRRADDVAAAGSARSTCRRSTRRRSTPVRVVFGTNCASCHGGAKWTKSQVFYLNNPSFVMGQPRDPGLVINAAQVISYSDAKVDPGTLLFLDTGRHLQRRQSDRDPGPGQPGRATVRRARLQHPDDARRQLQPAVLPQRVRADARGGLRGASGGGPDDPEPARGRTTGRTCSHSCDPSTAARTSSSPRATASRIRSRACSDSRDPRAGPSRTSPGVAPAARERRDEAAAMSTTAPLLELVVRA